MVIAEKNILVIDPKFRLCYVSEEKPLAYFKYYTQVSQTAKPFTWKTDTHLQYVYLF